MFLDVFGYFQKFRTPRASPNVGPGSWDGDKRLLNLIIGKKAETIKMPMFSQRYLLLDLPSTGSMNEVMSGK